MSGRRQRPALVASLPLAAACLLFATACLRKPEGPPLRVGTSGDYPPFTLNSSGTYEGLDIEIARRFANDTGRRLVLVRTKWPDLVDDLRAGRFDVAMGGVTMRPERAAAGTFTRPVAWTGTVILVRSGVTPTLQHLDRGAVRVAVNSGGHLERVSRRLLPHASLLPVQDNMTLPWLLDTDAAEALVTDDIEADLIVGRLRTSVRRLGPLTHDRKAYLGTDRALVADLDAWLRAHEADGSLAELRTERLGPTRAGPRSRFESDLAGLVALVDLRLAFMPAVALAKEAAGRPIEDQAQEEAVLRDVRALATTAGLDPERMAAFFRAQIAAARAVQRALLAMPADARPRLPPVDLVREARPALAALSADIVARAAEVVSDGPALAAVDPGTIAAELDASFVPAAHRRAIADTIVALR